MDEILMLHAPHVQSLDLLPVQKLDVNYLYSDKAKSFLLMRKD